MTKKTTSVPVLRYNELLCEVVVNVLPHQLVGYHRQLVVTRHRHHRKVTSSVLLHGTWWWKLKGASDDDDDNNRECVMLSIEVLHGLVWLDESRVDMRYAQFLDLKLTFIRIWLFAFFPQELSRKIHMIGIKFRGKRWKVTLPVQNRKMHDMESTTLFQVKQSLGFLQQGSKICAGPQVQWCPSICAHCRNWTCFLTVTTTFILPLTCILPKSTRNWV